VNAEIPHSRIKIPNLECGIIGEKYPQMDMISYVPTLRGAHSPDERLLIESVPQVWDLTIEFLKILK